MAADILRQLLRKKERAPKVGRGLGAPKRIGRSALIERRNCCMAQLARLRRNESVSAILADKAGHLLTAHWAASSWRARADILRTAEWLLGISHKVAGAASPPGRQGRIAESDGHDAQRRLDPVVP